MRITLFRRGSGGWWVRYRHKGRQFRKSLRTDNRKIAEDLRTEVEWKLRRGEALPGNEVQVGIKEFFEEYKSHSQANKRPKSHATDVQRIKAFLDSLRVVNIQDVATVDVVRYFNMKRNVDGVTDTTILRIREILDAFFRHAERLGYLHENPVAKTLRPRLPDRQPRFLRQADIDVCL